MKEVEKCRVVTNKEICKDVFLMELKSFRIAKNAKEGQFLELYPSNNKNILPRPLSICSTNKDSGLLRIVYKIMGEGTKEFSTLKEDDSIKVLGPLGNGFKIDCKERIAIVGGGVGTPPLLWLTKTLVEQNSNSIIDIYLGFLDYPFLVEEFQKIKSGYNDVNIFVATENGCMGHKGNVIDLMKKTGKEYQLIYSCGPKPMLKAVANISDEMNAYCQVSTEEKMACGIGACVGCVIKIKDGDNFIYKKVCKDGPVFNSKEVCWDE